MYFFSFLHCGHSHVIDLKVTVHPKINILSSFSHPQVVPNLYEFLSSGTFKKILCFFHTMEVNEDHQLFGYQHFSTEERVSYKFSEQPWLTPCPQKCVIFTRYPVFSTKNVEKSYQKASSFPQTTANAHSGLHIFLLDYPVSVGNVTTG